MQTRSQHRPSWIGAAGLATALAFGSAAISLSWTLGGTLLLDTVGGSIERIARTRSVEAAPLGGATTLGKVAAGVLSLALLQPRGGRLPARPIARLNLIVSAGPVARGAANVVARALVLGGVLMPSSHPDERALGWHLFGWDLWFLVWGIVLALAVIAQADARRRRRDRSRSRAANARRTRRRDRSRSRAANARRTWHRPPGPHVPRRALVRAHA